MSCAARRLLLAAAACLGACTQGEVHPDQQTPVKDIAELAGTWVGRTDILAEDIERHWYQWVALAPNGRYAVRCYSKPFDETTEPPATSVTFRGVLIPAEDGTLKLASTSGSRSKLARFVGDSGSQSLRGGGDNGLDRIVIEWRRLPR